MAVPDILLGWIIFLQFFLESLKYLLHDGSHDRVPVAVKPPQKTIECEVDFWYLVGDGDLDFEVVHWATPPDVLIDIKDGCSPFFMPDQSLSRNFRTTSNNCRFNLRLQKLGFVADRPPPSSVFEQITLMAAEESREYF